MSVCRWDIVTSAHSLVALTAAFLSGAAAGTFVMVRCALPHAHTRARARALMGGQAGRPAARLQVMWAMMAQYKPVYTSALSAGMGLSGLIPAALALLQSHVREPPCCPRRPIAHSVRYRGFSGRRGRGLSDGSRCRCRRGATSWRSMRCCCSPPQPLQPSAGKPQPQPLGPQ